MKAEKRGIFNFNTKVYWVLNHNTAILDRFSGGITITMVCKGMRKKGYGFSWSTGQQMMRNGIHTVKKAKEVSDMLFEEYGIFIPYIELIGFRDVVTDNIESEI
jgi:hypothetical protein